MIEFEIDALLFSRALDAVSTISKEPAIVFEPAGMSIIATRGDQVILLQLSIMASEFEVFDVGEKRSKICFNVDALQKYMRGVKGSAMLAIQDTMITLMLPSKYGFKTFDTPLLVELPATLVPKALKGFDSFCKVEIGALQEVIRDAGILDSEYLRFEVNDNNLDAVIKGDKGTARNSIEEGKGILKSQFDSNTKFSVVTVNFAEAVNAGKAFTNIIKMSFSQQLLPQRFEFQVPFDGTLISYLAPLVEPDAE